MVPGNHDHALAAPWLARMRLYEQELQNDAEWPVITAPAPPVASPSGCRTPR